MHNTYKLKQIRIIAEGKNSNALVMNKKTYILTTLYQKTIVLINNSTLQLKKKLIIVYYQGFFSTHTLFFAYPNINCSNVYMYMQGLMYREGSNVCPRCTTPWQSWLTVMFTYAMIYLSNILCNILGYPVFVHHVKLSIIVFILIISRFFCLLTL